MSDSSIANIFSGRILFLIAIVFVYVYCVILTSRSIILLSLLICCKDSIVFKLYVNRVSVSYSVVWFSVVSSSLGLYVFGSSSVVSMSYVVNEVLSKLCVGGAVICKSSAIDEVTSKLHSILVSVGRALVVLDFSTASFVSSVRTSVFYLEEARCVLIAVSVFLEIIALFTY